MSRLLLALGWAMFLLRMSLMGMVSAATITVLAVAAWSVATEADLHSLAAAAVAVGLLVLALWILRFDRRVNGPLEPPRLQKLQTPDTGSTPSVYSDHEASD